MSAVRRGRPKTTAPRTEVLHVRVSAGEAARLRELAAADERSLSQWVARGLARMGRESTKLRAVERVIEWHFRTQRGLREVYYVEPDERDDTPIKLLEVNADAMATGDVTPFVFARTDDVPYAQAVAEISPDELGNLQAHPDKLPRGWSLSRAVVFRRPSRSTSRKPKMRS